jgi:hypothetical protein
MNIQLINSVSAFSNNNNNNNNNSMDIEFMGTLTKPSRNKALLVQDT